MSPNPLFSGLLFTPLRRIPTSKGEVRHALRASDAGFAGFGEAYFTEVLPGAIKGWKRHRVMTLNLVVVVGTIRFTIHDGAGSGRRRAEYVISAEDTAPYGRLTVPPGLWMAFQGVGRGHNLLMNLASHEHDPTEAESCALDAFADALPATAQDAPAAAQDAPATAQDAHA
jgi:dTDP-4-dehydrorhamnose 3,5-epimerase